MVLVVGQAFEQKAVEGEDHWDEVVGSSAELEAHLQCKHSPKMELTFLGQSLVEDSSLGDREQS